MIAAALILVVARVALGQEREIPSIEYSSVVTFGIALGNNRQPVGDIEIALFDNYVPWTAANFAQLAYGGTQDGGGDLTTGDGTGGISIYGYKFQDENFNLQHYGAGWVSMANSGRNTNNSQFFITLRATPELNGKHVVFGKIIKGMRLVRAIAGLQTDQSERPTRPIVIYKTSFRRLGEGGVQTPLTDADPNS